MIKQVTFAKPAENEREWKKLSRFLDALGFTVSAEWQEGKLRGSAFTAPVGRLEIYSGGKLPYADVLVEVSDVRTVRGLAEKAEFGEVGKLRRTPWSAELFELESGGVRIAFWQAEKAKPLPYQNVEGELNVRGARFGIVVSRFNAFITERLLESATDALRRTGTREKDIVIVRVPGAFEVPLSARKLAQTGKVDAVICLGLLMRGETSNYEHISDEVARGIGQAAQETGVPCSYGVLTCDTLEQAIDRAGLKMGNKGFEAAMAAVEMVSLGRKLKPGTKRKTAAKRAGVKRKPARR